MERVRAGFRSHKTLDYDYRVTQLRNLKKLLEENEQQIMAALKADLSKVQLFVMYLGGGGGVLGIKTPLLKVGWKMNPFPSINLLSFWGKL